MLFFCSGLQDQRLAKFTVALTVASAAKKMTETHTPHAHTMNSSNPSSTACQDEFLKMHRALRRTLLLPPSDSLRAYKDADDFAQKQKSAKDAVEFYCNFNPLPPCNCAAKYAAQQREQYIWPRMSFTTRVKSFFF